MYANATLTVMEHQAQSGIRMHSPQLVAELHASILASTKITRKHKINLSISGEVESTDVGSNFRWLQLRR